MLRTQSGNKLKTLDDAYKGGNEGFAIHGSGLAAKEATPKHELEKDGDPIVVSSLSDAAITHVAHTNINNLGEITVIGGKHKANYFTANLPKLAAVTQGNDYALKVIDRILGKGLVGGTKLGV